MIRSKGGDRCEDKVEFSFHGPNPPGVAAEYILKELIEANKPKAERAIREARERETKRDGLPAESD